MKRVALTFVITLALLSGPFSVAVLADSTACLQESTPGCTHGLPTDQYNALLTQMQANPTPDVAPVPYDKNEIWSYGGFWRLQDGAQLYDSPGGNVVETAPVGFNFVSLRTTQGEYAQIYKNKLWVLRSELKQSYASTFT